MGTKLLQCAARLARPNSKMMRLGGGAAVFFSLSISDANAMAKEEGSTSLLAAGAVVVAGVGYWLMTKENTAATPAKFKELFEAGDLQGLRAHDWSGLVTRIMVKTPAEFED